MSIVLEDEIRIDKIHCGYQAVVHEEGGFQISVIDATAERARLKLQLFLKLLDFDRGRYCFADLSLEEMQAELDKWAD